MRAPAEDAVGSLNCIGFCDSKIFQKRGRIYRPIKLYEPPIRQEEGIQPGRTRCASIRPYRLHIPSEERIEPVIPVAKPKNVKRMHTRRDRIRKANSVEQQSADEFHDDTPVNEKEDDSPPPPAQILSRILFAICGILTVSLGLVVVIYTFIILFSWMSSLKITEISNSKVNTKFERVSPTKITFMEWEEKNAQKGRLG